MKFPAILRPSNPNKVMCVESYINSPNPLSAYLNSRPIHISISISTSHVGKCVRVCMCETGIQNGWQGARDHSWGTFLGGKQFG